MPRYRNTNEPIPTLVGRLLLLIANGQENSASLAKQLGITPRQVNRYVVQLIDGGWQIERVGKWTREEYWFELKSPRLVLEKAATRESFLRTRVTALSMRSNSSAVIGRPRISFRPLARLGISISGTLGRSFIFTAQLSAARR